MFGWFRSHFNISILSIYLRKNVLFIDYINTKMNQQIFLHFLLAHIA